MYCLIIYCEKLVWGLSWMLSHPFSERMIPGTLGYHEVTRWLVAAEGVS